MNAGLQKKLVCLLSGLFVCAVGATEVAEKDWEYQRLDDGHVALYNEDQSRRASVIETDVAGDLAIPSSIKNMRVVSIGQKAFADCTNLTSVVIPEGVTNIDASAFLRCSSLTNVTFPQSLLSIGSGAFESCTKLREVALSDSLVVQSCAFTDCSSLRAFAFDGETLEMGENCFSNCVSLADCDVTCSKRATIGDSAFSCGGSLLRMRICATNATIGAQVCRGCSDLTNVVIRASRLTVGDLAWADCAALKDVVITAAESATLGVASFANCGALKTLELPAVLTEIAVSNFTECVSLDAVSLPINLVSIGYRAFDTCTSLKELTISEGLKSIADQAFYKCSALQALQLPQTLESIGARTFEKCTSLSSVAIAGGNTNIAEAASLTLGERAFYKCGALQFVLLPERLTVIPKEAFAECETLGQVNLPTNLTVIADSAFETCSALPTLAFQTNLTSIGSRAFADCTALTGFLIPTNQVVSIGDMAFSNTRFWNDYPDNQMVINNGYILGFKGTLSVVTLPEGCTEITSGMFENMTNLTTVIVPSSVVSVGARAFAGSGIRSIALTNATALGNSAFEGCAALTNVVLAAGLTNIPAHVFQNCGLLDSIEIPAAVTAIGEYAFESCTRLTTVTGGDSVRNVGDFAFANCPNLQAFEFPGSVTFGLHVFQGCTWTEHVLFPSEGTMQEEYPTTYADIRSIVFSQGLTVVTNGACAGCAALSSVRIPSSVTTICTNAFGGCAGLTTVLLPASVTTVAPSAFAGCTNISSATIGGEIPVSTLFPAVAATIRDLTLDSETTTLCADLFAGCLGLTALDIPWRVTSIGARAFYGCTNLVGSLVIPECVESIGSQAFGYCVGLKTVLYLCDRPEVESDIYRGTASTLVSGVLLVRSGWTSSDDSSSASDDADDDADDDDLTPSATTSSTDSDSSGRLPYRWPACSDGRRIAWWTTAKLAKVAFLHYNGTGGSESAYFLANAGRTIDEAPDAPEEEKEGCTFAGWFDAPYGGNEISFPLEVTTSLKIYAHWTYDDAEDEDSFDFSRAHGYCAYLKSGDALVGTMTLKVAKGKWNKTDEETNAVVTATIQLLGEGKVTLRGTLDEGLSAELAPTKKTDERTLSLAFDDNGLLTGSFDDYEIAGYRNLFAEETTADKYRALAVLDDVRGSYAVALQAAGDAIGAQGYAALSVKVLAKGKAKVTGVLPDGTKVSVSGQVVCGDEGAVLPVLAPLYSGKKGGFAFLLTLPSGETEASIGNCSDWTALGTSAFTVSWSEALVARVANLAADAEFACEDSFAIDGLDVADISPDGTAITVSGTRWTLPRADTVKFTDGDYEVTTERGNPAALKLSYTAGTGLFKGSYKVFCITEAGRSKKYAATVNGAVVNGVGYGTAFIRNLGGIPITVVP